MQKAGVNGRRADIKTDIETLLRLKDKASADAARKKFITSVVEDTQFVYASTHTPLITQSLGGVGRVFAIFQTWWLNYGTTIHKWMTTGTLEAKAERMMTNVLSGAVAYSIMTRMWDHEVAAKTMFAGPFPSARELIRMPPMGEAMWQNMKVIQAMAGLAEGEKAYTEKVQQQIARAARTSLPSVIPGGLQMKMTWDRGSKEGLPGVVKSIIRYKKDGG